MAKLNALVRACEFSAPGKTMRDKAALFVLALLNQADHRRVLSRQIAAKILRLLSLRSGKIRFQIKVAGRIFPVVCRADDFGDYQTIWECFGGMYHFPTRPVQYIFDGGANLGLFSLVAIADLGIKESIVVEPDPDNFKLLEENLAAFSGVRKLRSALAAENGHSTFYRLSSNGGYLRVESSPVLESARNLFTVQTCRLPDIFPAHWNASLTWLKLDIEGAEYEVFVDMLASGMRPAFISAELHDYLHAGGDNLVQSLRLAGYKVQIEGSGRTGNVCRQIHAFLK
jgi:FkbM family methyltransferase